jgi:hypothetical protein
LIDILEENCMSFVPAPQKATSAGAANATNQINGTTSAVNNVTPAAAEAGEAGGGEDAFITSRTFDLYWVDKTALMYRDGYVKVRLFWRVLRCSVREMEKTKLLFRWRSYIHIM